MRVESRLFFLGGLGEGNDVGRVSALWAAAASGEVVLKERLTPVEGCLLHNRISLLPRPDLTNTSSTLSHTHVFRSSLVYSHN